ncbi:MAG: host attachment protein [Hyphomicrobiaceae bacterium]|nr:host attachment protein [Hyphomicrobiaceae bacterium]
MLVADTAQAKLFVKTLGAYCEREEIRYVAEPDLETKPYRDYAFAHQLAARLQRDVGMKRFDRLVIVGAPSLMEDLRYILGREVSARVIAEIDTDLISLPPDQLSAKLGELLWF